MLTHSLQKKKAFTLLEVMLALAIVSGTLVMIYTSINQAVVSQKRAEDLTVATYLAQQIMETIKSQEKDIEEEYSLDSFPNFSASYSIKEEEFDLAGLAGQKENSHGTVTGGIFTLKHYQVIITYGQEQNYILDFYRGQGVNN